MLIEDIAYMIAGAALAIAIILLTYKFYYVHLFRKTYKRKLPFRLFTVYPMNQVYGTSSAEKKRWMTRCNVITIVADICLVPVAIVAIIHIVNGITYLLETLISRVD